MWPAVGFAHQAHHDQRLPMIGSAPGFALTSQDGLPVTLSDYRGKVLLVTLIFASITVDPERDTPEVLKQYTENFGADLAGWAFLAGDPAAIGDVGRRHGLSAAKAADGDVTHTSLTSLIDSRGILRVQYLGIRFDLEEFRSDLVGLLDESARP